MNLNAHNITDILLRNILLLPGMQPVEIPDDAGDTIVCKRFKGHLLPNFQDTTGLERLLSVTIRPDDVILCSYPKSGTHWLFEMTREILMGKAIHGNVSMVGTFLEKIPEVKYADIPSPRILSTHVRPDLLPVDIFKKKNKIIFIVRNPKDVAVSYYNFMKKIPYYHYDGDWENYVRPFTKGKFPYESWFDYHRNWNEIRKSNPNLPFFVASYEDMKQNQLKEMKRLAQFLGVTRDDEFLKNVIQQTSFDSMKDHGAVSKAIFRKGQVGDWKNWFTVAQNEWFDSYYKEHIKDIPFDIKFTLPDNNSL